jgi:uncharacterized protein
VTDVSALAHVAAFGAALCAGGVNAIAGGGTLITFPVLTAIGVPAVRANATNTVALLPGYAGGTYAQREDLAGLSKTVRPQLIASALGGLAGGILLIITSESLFREIVPYLMLSASLLLAVQDKLRSWIFREGHPHQTHLVAQTAAITLAAIYGGYFGAGLSIMLIAVLGLFSDLPFTRLNAIKLLLALVINVSAALFLMFSGKVEWSLVAIMAPAALIGGNVGGRLARVVSPTRLRGIVVFIGVAVSIVYFVK